MGPLSDIEPIEAILMKSHGLLEGPSFGREGEVVYSDVFRARSAVPGLAVALVRA